MRRSLGEYCVLRFSALPHSCVHTLLNGSFVSHSLSIVARISAYCEHYSICEPHIKEVLMLFSDLYETARHCQSEQALTFHITHQDYTKAAKHKLKSEVCARLESISWRLSTELLKMQLAVRNRAPDDRKPMGWKVAGLAAAVVAHKASKAAEFEHHKTDYVADTIETVEPEASAEPKPSRTTLFKRAAIASSAIAGVVAPKSKEEMACIIRTEFCLAHPFDCHCQTKVEKKLPWKHLARTAAGAVTSLSLMQSIREQSLAAQARVRAENEAAAMALVRARMAASKLRRRVELMKQARENRMVHSSNAMSWAEARRRAEEEVAAVSEPAARATGSPAEKRGMRDLLAMQATDALGYGQSFSGESVWPTPPDRVRRMQDQGRRSGAITAAAINDSAKAARALAMSTSPRFVDVDADFADGFLRIQKRDLLLRQQVSLRVGGSRHRGKRTTNGSGFFAAEKKSSQVEAQSSSMTNEYDPAPPNTSIEARRPQSARAHFRPAPALPNARLSTSEPLSARASPAASRPQSPRTWRPAPTLSSHGARPQSIILKVPSSNPAAPIKSELFTIAKRSGGSPALRLLVPLRDLEKTLHPLLVREDFLSK